MAYSVKTINEALRSDPAGFVAECEAKLYVTLKFSCV